jgi:hypothetical protein
MAIGFSHLQLVPMVFKMLLLCVVTAFAAVSAQTIAMHQLVVVEPTGDAVIRLLGYNNAMPSPQVSNL